ncbi:MAG: hypothetical protein GXO57_06470 [Thermodesulfobacteria bacterium]|nr:hypothetical protein [Thermodesulfobacteriota bacterium]
MGQFLNFFKRLFKKRTGEVSEVEEEIKELLEDFKEENILSGFEENFILNFLELKNLEVRELVIPINRLVGLEFNMSWEQVKETISKFPHLFYPVYKKSIDNLEGVAYIKDLVTGMHLKEFNWRSAIDEVLMIPENISVVSALEKLIEKRKEVAFAIDEHSELTGMFRLKDVFRELVKNEIICPHPDPEGWILLPATFKLRHLEKCFNIELPKGDFETISGLIISHLKRIPAPGEKVWIPPLEVEILRATPRKIELLKVRIHSSS